MRRALTSPSGIQRGHRTSVCLFEWNHGGHFPIWARAAAESLDPEADVTLAACDPVLEELADLGLPAYSLGDPRPSVGGGDLAADHTPADLARTELRLLREACSAIEPDHCFHLFTDPVLRWWLREKPMPSRMSILLFHALSHYPRSHGVPLSWRQRLQGAYIESKLRRWRRRPDAHACFTNDMQAAARWSERSGAIARWLPDPPVPPPRGTPPAREGCVLFGAIDRRKGFDLFADAIALAPVDLRVLLAGHVAPAVQREFDASVQRMREAGARVELDLGPDGVLNGVDILARARCAVLPYRTHLGISRVLMEAAVAGTPVIGPAWGPNGRLIRDFGLGLAVDPSDRSALREAVLELSGDPDAAAVYAPGLRRYAEERGGEKFGETLRSVFGVTESHP